MLSINPQIFYREVSCFVGFNSMWSPGKVQQSVAQTKPSYPWQGHLWKNTGLATGLDKQTWGEGCNGSFKRENTKETNPPTDGCLTRLSRHCKFPASCQGNIITLCYNQYFSLFPAAKAVDQFCVYCMGPRPSHNMQHAAQVRLGLKCIFPFLWERKSTIYRAKKHNTQNLWPVFWTAAKCYVVLPGL